MLFNSIDFFIFLPLVFIIYWYGFNRNLKYQNLFILFSSYLFYGWWDWRFLSLIIFSSLIDYIISLRLRTTQENFKRKILLSISISVNLGFLGFFKYYNFFVDNFVEAFSFFGHSFNPQRLSIILPVGISFYTFQTLSYTFDVYKRKLEPTKDLISFLAFVSFFPQLVAGPIERAKNLLPQFYEKRSFNYDLAVDGMRQILWGLFKKIVIADNCALYVNNVFSNYSTYSGGELFIATIFFAFQIYCDFSGYSDIAIGTARLFGFSLMRNFAFPYFSRDIAEFWRRWHISLSTWFRDYLYIPLGGSQGGVWVKIRNTLIIFIVSGFWHGANWTFIVWGALNAIYFLPLLIANRNRNNLDIVAQGKILPGLKDFLRILFTFLLTLLAWVFFRSENLTHAFAFLNRMLIESSIISLSGLKVFFKEFLTQDITPLLIIFIITEWFQRAKHHALESLFINSRTLRWVVYLLVFLAILIRGVWTEQDFIYFQF